MQNRMLSVSLCILSLIVAACGQTLPASQSPAQQKISESLSQLPQDLRERAQTLASDTDETRRARAAIEIARRNTEATTAFLLAAFDAEPSARVRTVIIDNLG